ncbi:hypothetical protein G9C98_003939 [Cotesia typhae]|uniref:MD-2-related lipid-recognition domain-containing protein n=1 Tax=Cotesia typhae TaxID=2053667 RepID=A0A8J5UQY0_9HYME|nr:hypothetical protein G9C98_003939 [Cotesia typhae]
MSRAIFIVIFTLMCLTFLTEAVEKSYIQCKNSPGGSSNIRSLSITNCDVPPCILKKRNTVFVEEIFSVDKDVSKLTTKVSAKVFGVDLPFVSVDSTDACQYLYNMDDTKAACPLKAGGIYKYKNSFYIFDFYPNILTTVTWKLVDFSRGKPVNITCFQIEARIKK